MSERIEFGLAAVIEGVGRESPDGDEPAEWNAITGLHFAMALAVEAPEAFAAYREEWAQEAPNDYAAFAEAAAWVAERHDRAGAIGPFLSAAYAEAALMRD